MRSAPTLSELKLWTHLRKRQIARFKFRRQYVIHTFIVDFYCPAAKLIIEVDGPIHFSQGELDKEREEYLKSLGYRVIRFTNEQVTANLEAVIMIIRSNLAK